MTRTLWPVAEAAQADYELLRNMALFGSAPADRRLVDRFTHGGLAGLIARPVTSPSYLLTILGASRPAWSGRDDPRELALQETYGFLLGAFPESFGAEVSG